MKQKRFQKRIENFTCAVCHMPVQGNGYTNHCCHCLWSLHCDVNPGDRAESCRGLMEPIQVEVKSQVIYLTHKCTKCGIEKRIQTDEKDSQEVLIELMRSA